VRLLVARPERLIEVLHLERLAIGATALSASLKKTTARASLLSSGVATESLALFAP
jgi:hypothetical protein